MSLDDILDSQDTLLGSAFNLDPSTGRNVPIRPVLDGSLINTPLDSTKPFPTVTKPVLVTSVTQEAAFAIYSTFPNPLPEEALTPVCDDTFGEERTDVVVSSPHYAVPPAVNGSADARVQLQTIGTDYLWKCSGWTFARNWVQHGGTAYVGQFVVGASYPGNEVVPYCLTPGVVCHQDDIQIVVSLVFHFTLPLSCFLPFLFSSLALCPIPTVRSRLSLQKSRNDTKHFLTMATQMPLGLLPGPKPPIPT